MLLSGITEGARAMNSRLHGIQDLHERLLKVERQNLRFKRIGAAALVVAVSLLVMGQASQKKTVEANEFVLRDDSGNMRAKLSVDEKTSVAQFLLLDKEGRLDIKLDSAWGGSLAVADAQGTTRVNISSTAILLKGNERESLYLDPTAVGFTSSNGIVKTTLGQAQLHLTDDQGFSASLGLAELVTPRTGEVHKTSAASLVLFDKDKNVIWKAP
jgi:hypothetical protein